MNIYHEKNIKYKTKYLNLKNNILTGGVGSNHIINNIIIPNSTYFYSKMGVPEGDNLTENIIKKNLSLGSTLDNEYEKQLKIFNSVKVVCSDEIINYFCDYIKEQKRKGNMLSYVYNKTIKNPYYLINRFLTKRPIVFYLDSDYIKFIDGSVNDKNNFYNYSTDVLNNNDIKKYFPLDPFNYMIYDELKLSALLVVSCKSKFINTCDKNNLRKTINPNDYVEEGIVIGGVGPRFEKLNVMDVEDMIIHKNSKGGFKNNFYTTSREFISAIDGVSLKDYIFDIGAYKKRIELLAKLCLLESNIRAKEEKKKGYITVQGLGLGEWSPTKIFRVLLNNNTLDFNIFFNKIYLNCWKDMIKKYIDILDNIEVVFFPFNKDNNELEYISINNSSHKINVIRHNSMGSAMSKEQIKNVINIYNPGFQKSQIDTELLCCLVFAWDSNSYPGNEYWRQLYAASMDPVICSCSQISEILNEHINPYYKDVGLYFETVRNVDDILREYYGIPNVKYSTDNNYIC